MTMLEHTLPQRPIARPRLLMHAEKPTRKPRPHDPADFADILRKRDNRLIGDIGLTREEILGPEKSFWREWLKIKAPWQL